jgi:hypothetical protein
VARNDEQDRHSTKSVKGRYVAEATRARRYTESRRPH